MHEATRRFDVEQHHHLVVDRRESADAGSVGAGAEIRRRLHGIGGHVVDLRDRVDHDARRSSRRPPRRTRTTMTTVELSKGFDSRPKRARRSMTGTMTPRRFMTPSTIRRRVGHARHAVPALDLLHAQDLDAVLHARAHEGQVLRTARGVRRAWRKFPQWLPTRLSSFMLLDRALTPTRATCSSDDVSFSRGGRRVARAAPSPTL